MRSYFVPLSLVAATFMAAGMRRKQTTLER